MKESTVSIDLSLDRLELGRLYSRIMNFDEALKALEQEATQARAEGHMERWSACVPLILRILAEQMNMEKFESWRKQIQQVETKGDAGSSLQYVLGIGACYSGQSHSARVHFLKALDLQKSHQDQVQAQFGLCSVLSMEKNFSECLQSLKDLESSLADTLFVDFKLAALQLKGICLREQGEWTQALEVFERAEKMAKSLDNLYMCLNLTFLQGTVFEAMGNTSKAQLHYDVVVSLGSQRNLAHLNQQIQKRSSLMAQRSVRQILLEEQDELRVTLEGGPAISFGNQRLLFRLLKMLGSCGDRGISKEELVAQLWKEEYDPFVHDNKIYVTIRRLRKLLESKDGPPLVIRDESGYRMAQNVCVQRAQ